jgi:uracil-DNA glycosylase family 4
MAARSTSPDPALARIARDIVACERCPRLVRWCREVAASKRRAYRDWTYWGRPVPGFGDARARIWVLGLAPAAHGGNRTGRVFTGDSSGDWLFRALYDQGFARLPTSESRHDGQRLRDVYVSAAARCAPPGNRPTPAELERCAPFLAAELAALPRLRVVVALGRIAFDAALRLLDGAGYDIGRPRPRFAHGGCFRIGPRRFAPGVHILASYHPSRQNTQTGRLTREMLDAVFRAARDLARGRQARLRVWNGGPIAVQPQTVAKKRSTFSPRILRMSASASPRSRSSRVRIGSCDTSARSSGTALVPSKSLPSATWSGPTSPTRCTT